MTGTLITLFDRLMARYGKRHWWPADTPFEVCIGAILTQNTAWSNVEKAIANLKAADALTPTVIRGLALDHLASLIRPSGFFNVKAVRLKGFVAWLDERHGGSLEQMFAADWREVRCDLLRVKGIGAETADSILLYAGGKPTFVVDAYTRRIFSRLGLLPEYATPYETVRELCLTQLPVDPQLFNEYHALIVEHAKTHCRSTPRCTDCPLAGAPLHCPCRID
jgi:endonuclease-3 related protein